MHLKWIKGSCLVVSAAVLLLAPTSSLYANCGGGATIAHTNNGYFANCGPDPVAFVWAHGRAIQGVVNGEAIGAANSLGAHDSGVRSGALDAVFIPALDVDSNPIPNGWTGNTDFNATGYDGCVYNFLDNPTCTCATSCVPGAQDFGVLDYVIAGVDPSQPNVARAAAVSVDFNQGLQGWLLDNAGAPNVDGDACGGNAFSFRNVPIDCVPIPVPVIQGSGPATGGVNITFNITQPVPFNTEDDCLIAQSPAQNCPRNFYAGRVLMFKHGGCTNTTAPAERRAWTYPAAPASGNLTVAPNWLIYSLEDADLDGVLDPGEDGVGGTVNGFLDPFLVPGSGNASPVVKVPAVPTATDCIFFGLGLALDNNRASVNPPTNTIFGTLVVSPAVSVNPNPVRAGTGTPVADLVTVITVSKGQGKGTVNWETGVEMTTSGFNVIGTKKNGGETKLNGSLIAAKEGTTGKGAAYTVTFDASQLKGSSSVYVEIVKTDGSKERFGPASF